MNRPPQIPYYSRVSGFILIVVIILISFLGSVVTLFETLLQHESALITANQMRIQAYYYAISGIQWASVISLSNNAWCDTMNNNSTGFIPGKNGTTCSESSAGVYCNIIRCKKTPITSTGEILFNIVSEVHAGPPNTEQWQVQKLYAVTGNS